MTTALEQILETVASLSDEEQAQLGEILANRRKQAPMRDLALVNKVYGSFAHVQTSSDAFAARKAEEIEIEERRFRGK